MGWLNEGIIWGFTNHILVHQVNLFVGCYDCEQVPVTNFFGSVMKTIHTDSAYTGFSAEPKIKLPYVLEDNEEDRIMLERDAEDKIYSQDKKVSFGIFYWWENFKEANGLTLT